MPLPHSGFNLRQTTHGAITFKLWDLSGQPKFRPAWTRYCLGVAVVIFVVDSADGAAFAVARDELHSLLGELPGVVSPMHLVSLGYVDGGADASVGGWLVDSRCLCWATRAI